MRVYELVNIFNAHSLTSIYYIRLPSYVHLLFTNHITEICMLMRNEVALNVALCLYAANVMAVAEIRSLGVS